MQLYARKIMLKLELRISYCQGRVYRKAVILFRVLLAKQFVGFANLKTNIGRIFTPANLSSI